MHPTEAVLLGQAADLTGEPVSAWVRGVAVEAARAALAEHGPMPELAPCPECAERPEVEEYGPGDWHVSCAVCLDGVDPLTPGELDRVMATGESRREAIAAWADLVARTCTAAPPSTRGRAARGTTRT